MYAIDFRTMLLRLSLDLQSSRGVTGCQNFMESPPRTFVVPRHHFFKALGCLHSRTACAIRISVETNVSFCTECADELDVVHRPIIPALFLAVAYTGYVILSGGLFRC